MAAFFVAMVCLLVALCQADTLVTWGTDQYSTGDVLGDLSDKNALPTPVDWGPLSGDPPTNFKSLCAGDYFTVALTEDGRLFSWGLNSNGELGDNTTEPRPFPAPVVSPSNTTEPLTGVEGLSCAGAHVLVMIGGFLYAWGSNQMGQLGTGTDTNVALPVLWDPSCFQCESCDFAKAPTSRIVSFAAYGDNSACADEDGNMYTWGDNGYWQLGSNSTQFWQQFFPRMVVWGDAPRPEGGIVQVSGGGGYTLAVSAGGGVYAWGSDVYGQMGRAVHEDYYLYMFWPGEVNWTAVGYTPNITVIAGTNTPNGPNGGSVAASDGNTIFTWGSNGDGYLLGRPDAQSMLQSDVPMEIDWQFTTMPTSKIVQLAIGGYSMAALTESGMMFAWGFAQYLTVGKGSSSSVPYQPKGPVSVLVPPGLSHVAAGIEHMAGIKTTISQSVSPSPSISASSTTSPSLSASESRSASRSASRTASVTPSLSLSATPSQVTVLAPLLDPGSDKEMTVVLAVALSIGITFIVLVVIASFLVCRSMRAKSKEEAQSREMMDPTQWVHVSQLQRALDVERLAGGDFRAEDLVKGGAFGGLAVQPRRPRLLNTLFLSFAHSEKTTTFAHRLKHDLIARGFSVATVADGMPGPETLHEIGLAIEGCEGVIAIVDKAYCASKYTKNELHLANNCGKALFPCILERSEMSADLKYALVVVNWTRFDHKPYPVALEALVDGMELKHISRTWLPEIHFGFPPERRVAILALLSVEQTARRHVRRSRQLDSFKRFPSSVLLRVCHYVAGGT